MNAPRVVRVLHRVVAMSTSTRRVDRSFFIWHEIPCPEPTSRYGLRILGVINGFLRWLPFRLVTRGQHARLERWRSDWGRR